MLINGTPSSFFRSSRGLRLRDLLSPYRSVIVMEAFSQMIEKAVMSGSLSACQVGGRGFSGEEVSNLLFVDDTLIFVRLLKIR